MFTKFVQDVSQEPILSRNAGTNPIKLNRKSFKGLNFTVINLTFFMGHDKTGPNLKLIPKMLQFYNFHFFFTENFETIFIFFIQELESKLKEVFANGDKNVAKSVDNVGKRMATKFLAQVDIKEAETGSSKKQQTGSDENVSEKKEVKD
jgi:hypothetical protein